MDTYASIPDIARLKAVLDSMSYKSGAQAYLWGEFVRLSIPTIDANQGYSRSLDFFFNIRQAVDGDVKRNLANAFLMMEAHEVQEFLRFDGERMFQPHGMHQLAYNQLQWPEWMVTA